MPRHTIRERAKTNVGRAKIARKTETFPIKGGGFTAARTSGPGIFGTRSGGVEGSGGQPSRVDRLKRQLIESGETKAEKRARLKKGSR